MTGKNNKIIKEEQKKKIREKYKGLKKDDLILIPARPAKKLFEDSKHKRVCAYCRVSTDDVNQTSSYELQKNHYEDMIKEHPSWELIEIYADEGISGTSLRKRDSFNKMIVDCRNGKIDIIVTKSVSRFARNIVDCIQTVRELANLKNPVGVLFEAEHIYTLDNTSEMILAVLSATAQEESRTKSEIMNISIEQRFSRGIFLTPELLGYDKDEDGNLVINEEEAKTVKLCYYLFLGGYSAKDIASILTRLNRKTKLGNTTWSSGTVLGVLKNERHCGMVICHKTYTPNYLEHKSRPNKDVKNKWCKIDHHDPIVSKAVYDATMKMISSHKYMKNGRSLPTMKVIVDGILQGYIPVDRNWHGFEYEEYKLVSEAVMDEHIDKLDEIVENKGRNNIPRGFSVVNKQIFLTRESPILTLQRGQMYFNQACIDKFSSEYVELLLNIPMKKLAIRPVSVENSNALQWAKNMDGRFKGVKRSCSGLMASLLKLMEWNASDSFKVRGIYKEIGKSKVLIFELDSAVIIGDNNKKGVNWLINYEKKEKKYRKNRNKVYEVSVESDLLKKAVTVEELDILNSISDNGIIINELNEKDLNDFLVEAEKIIEGIREEYE